MDKLDEIVTNDFTQATQPLTAETLGLTRPLESVPTHELIERRVQKLYNKIFDTVNRQLTTDATAAATSAAAVTTANAAVAPQPPDVLLESMVDNRVVRAFASYGLVPLQQQDENMGEQGTNPTAAAATAQQVVESLQHQGNAATPLGGVGQNPQPNSPAPPTQPALGRGRGGLRRALTAYSER